MKLLTASVLVAIASVATFCGLALQKSHLTLAPEYVPPPQKITAANGKTGDLFGESLALDQSTILISAPLCRTGDSKSGAVYFYDPRNTESLGSPNRIAQHGIPIADFATTVAVSGPYAFVGSPTDSTGGESAGAVYAFENDDAGGWKQAAKLQANPPVPGSRFGAALAMDQNRAAVGVVSTIGAGAVYFFERDNTGHWQQTTMMTGSAANDLFGRSVAIAGDWAVVGAPGDNGVAPNGGAAYVSRFDSIHGWSKVAQLAPRNPPLVNSRFGHAVAIASEGIVVSAPGNAVAYLFREKTPGNWTEVARLVPQDRKQPFMFGFTVAICGDTIAVGSPLEDDGAGRMYLFRRMANHNWRQVVRLALPSSESSSCFGWRVALNEDMLLVGTPSGDGTAPKAGAAYLYSLREFD